ncbi:MAG: ubiquitin carboxyl-terminal hydrolase [Parachlamydiales bacterium]|nr:ubiquitin carboxyl-terminal hydrolase [Parachlamydiales bacterium]
MAVPQAVPLPPPPQAPQPQAAPQPSCDCCSMMLYVAEAVVQVAVRSIFIFANILMTAALLPVAWHWIALPLVAVGSTSMAAFFFPSFQVLAPSGDRIPVPRPVPMPANGLYPEHYPLGSPVGYRRLGQNCAFNSIAHFFDSDPQVSEWVRRPAVADGIDLPGFIQFLNRHRPPAEMIAEFQQYVAAQPHVRPTIPVLFSQFLAQYQPPAPIQAEVRRVRGIFQLFQNILPNFFRANDEAIGARRAVSQGRSEFLRAGMSAILGTIPASNFEQTDAAEIARGLLDFAPDAMKPLVRRTYNYNMDGLPAMAEARLPRQERETLLTLPLDRTTPAGTPLQTLYERFLRNTAVEPQRYMGVDGQPHEYPVTEVVAEFIEPPPVLRFQLNRFTHEQPIPSLLSRWFPSVFPPIGWRGVKLDTQIQFPEEFAITLADGRISRYRLASFVTHDGTFSSGHYTSGEIRGGQKFLHNDSHVTHVATQEAQEYWNAQLQSAYLVCYVPAPDAPAQLPPAQ